MHRVLVSGWRLALVLAALPTAVRGESRAVLDDFSDPARWQVQAADGVDLHVSSEPQADGTGAALRLDFQFVTGAGYAGVRRAVPLELPTNFELAFSVRGDLPKNNLEVKLVDPGGESVWWVNRRGFEFPREAVRLASRRRHFEFAWGPSSAPLSHASALEIVVASAEGGRGTVWLEDLTFRPLPETRPYDGTPTAAASSAAEEHPPQAALDGRPETAWRPAAADPQPSLTIDFGQPREFGGLVVHWDEAAYARRYAVELSDDGSAWTQVRAVDANSGRPQFLSLPDAEARAVRLVFSADASGEPPAIREIEVLPLETTQHANSLWREIADRAPRGRYPRTIAGEGGFWTIVGVPADEHEALVSEDGAVEVDKQAFSIEPLVKLGGRLFTWADAAETTHSLAAGFVPVPTVGQRFDDVRLSVTAAADGAAGRSALTLLYTATNASHAPVEGALLLALRPFQVNPPYQWLNTPGGAAPVERIELDAAKREVRIDGRVAALGATPDACGAATFDEGEAVEFLFAGAMPPHAAVADLQRGASAAVQYDFRLSPGESRSWAVVVPFGAERAVVRELADELLAAANPVRHVRERQQATIDRWRQAVSTVELLFPAEAADVADAVRSTLAYVLINQDGRAIHPGSRSYERSWIRDGSLTSAALLRFGLTREAREFVDWYADFQFADGKVPCVVDRRGPDPVPENDSHGQYVMAVMNVYRFTGDEEFLRRHWPHVRRAVAYIEQLRLQRMTGEFVASGAFTRQEPGKPPVKLRAFYGIMPESISHEGYSAKPMHSYWDDFFTLKGLKDAAEMAHVLGDRAQGVQYQALAADFARSLYESIHWARADHRIDYIPGCVELGDFDATSTTVALWPCGERHRLPADALTRTFDKYWERFVSRRDDPAFEWFDYTPYEMRTIGSFVLLDQPERVEQTLAYFMADRRPPAWNQWPEVIYREPRTPRFLGDLPHTWCGSDFVNSVRTMLLYERDDGAAVLLAGVPAAWLSPQAIGFRDLPTYGGRLSCTLAQTDGVTERFVAELSGTCPVPAGKLRLSVPGRRVERATLGGAPAEVDADGRVIVDRLPARVEIAATSPRS